MTETERVEVRVTTLRPAQIADVCIERLRQKLGRLPTEGEVVREAARLFGTAHSISKVTAWRRISQSRKEARHQEPQEAVS